MLLTDVLSKFQEYYGKYNELDNNGMLSGKDLSKKQYDLDNSLDNRDIKNPNYIHDNNIQSEDNLNSNYQHDTILESKDNSVSNFEYDNNTLLDDNNKSNMNYDNDITKEDNLQSSFDYENDTTLKDNLQSNIEYDNNLVEQKLTKPNMNLDNDLLTESEIEGYSINYDNIDIEPSDKANYEKQIGLDIIHESVEPKGKKIHLDNFISARENKEYENDFDAEYVEDPDINFTTNKYKQDNKIYENNIVEDNITIDEQQSILRNNIGNKFNDWNGVDNLSSYRKDIDISDIKKTTQEKLYGNDNIKQEETKFSETAKIGNEWEELLDPTSPNFTDSEFWTNVSKNAQEAWEKQFGESSDRNVSYNKDEFMKNLSNALDESIEGLNREALLLSGDISNIKNKFVNSTMNIVNNQAEKLTAVGTEFINETKEWAEYELYCLSKDIWRKLWNSDRPKMADGKKFLLDTNGKANIGVTAKFSGIDITPSTRFKPYQWSLLSTDPNYKAQKPDITDRYTSNRAHVLDLRNSKEFKLSWEYGHYNYYYTVGAHHTGRKDKIVNTQGHNANTNYSSIFKGFESVQDTLKGGVATDYYWDMTFEYYLKDATTTDKVKLPDFPYKGGWWPVKSFELDDDQLKTFDISIGENNIKILTERMFPKTLTINIIEDYYRQMEIFGSDYNKAVAKIQSSGVTMLSYDKQAFKINIAYMMPNYQIWKQVSYIAIPQFKQKNVGSETKDRKEYSIPFNIIGIADFEKDENDFINHNYFTK